MTTDPFAEAESSFLSLDDMVEGGPDGGGRLLLITPLSIEKKPSTFPNAKPGETYDSITADVVILDGKTTEKIPEVPYLVEGMFIGSSVVVPQLRPKLPRDGKPAGMVLGRAGTQPARTKGFRPSFVLNGNGYKVTDADRELARAYLATLDPFASS